MDKFILICLFICVIFAAKFQKSFSVNACRSMEDKRAKTLVPLIPARCMLIKASLEALEAFIQSQKALLSRTQSDIERLRPTREQAVSEPQLGLSNLAVEVSNFVAPRDGCWTS